MGNLLIGIAPSQIFPVEHYLADQNDLRFDISLGSTRFFKVARARSQEGLMVVKVFVIHDPTLPLLTHKNKLEEIRSKLVSAVNCLPFQQMILTEKAGFIIREYVKYSLYDRISTRPFLSVVEKKWITFQVLYALHQAHKLGVCHGDIKLENIMITSWNWILLTDFASFKPTYLPEDNPADFSYFFDTSRRRTCYIAPERFVKTLSIEHSNTSLFPEQELKNGDLHPMMDIFSAGCALTELYNEGHPPFDFSQLLAYRNEEYSVDKHLDNIEDVGIQELLTSMMEKNPYNRKSAELYLSQARGNIFPEYFYSFIQSYMQIFSSAPILSPDEKISRLKKDIGSIISIFKNNSNYSNSIILKTKSEKKKILLNADCDPYANSTIVKQFKKSSSITEKKDKKTSKLNYIVHPENTNFIDNLNVQEKNNAELEGLIIITQLVTSCIKGLHHSQSKLYSLDIMLELSKNIADEIILDRILPYIFYLVHDSSPRVRVSAIHTLTKCLYLVKTIPSSDINIFPEYILPGLVMLTQDEAVIVRAAYAENIACLAHIALRYLENSHALSTDDKNGSSYDNELQTLHEMIQQSVSMLLTDPNNFVKQTLIENGIEKLCEFFGKQKANDVLLSHIITFLNDKDDKELRCSFFDCIVDVAAYIGWHCSPILMPLLQQGLADSEEFVITKAINAMSTLTKLGVLHKSALYQLLYETINFLVHPNLWIRHATVGFISAAAGALNTVDMQCKVKPMLQRYIKHNLIQIEHEFLLLEALINPIPRIVLDSVIKYNDIEELFYIFEQRKVARAKTNAGLVPQYNNDMSTVLRSLFRRLSSELMSESVEDLLLIMKPHIFKINKHRCLMEAKNPITLIDGRFDLFSIKHKLNYHLITLHPDTKDDINLPTLKKFDRRSSEIISTYASMNQEWRTMFAAQENMQNLVVKLSNISGTNFNPIQSISNSDMYLCTQHSLTETITSNNDQSLHEKSYIQYQCAPCRSELRQLVHRKQDQYASTLRAQYWADNIEWQAGSRLLPSGWRPRGVLIAYLHEHRAAINRLVGIPDTSLFASSSSDGCIKIWDASKMEGRNIANRSRQTHVHKGGPLIGLVPCEENQSLASTASQTGTVFILRLELGSSKTSIISSRQLDLQEEGCAVDLQYLDSGSQSVLVYATLYGSLIGWDLRCPGTAWKLDNDLKHGIITSFCVNNYQQWLTLGTSSGTHICWDLRFQLPISIIKHPTGARVKKVITHPSEHSWIISAVQGNNEISIWNLETGFRQMVFWASSAPPLSQTQGGHSVCAMYSTCIDRSGFLLASGTDMRLRFWNLQTPNESYVVLPAVNDSLSPNSLSYEQRLIDGTNVVQEILSGGISGSNSTISPNIRVRAVEAGNQGPETSSPGHHDTISSVAMSNTCILTGSTDGLIQVWK